MTMTRKNHTVSNRMKMTRTSHKVERKNPATQNINNEKDNKLSLSNYVWIGFNFACNVTFVFVFVYLVAGSSSVKLGYNILWIFAIDAFLAFICSIAYVELVKHHHKVNGGAYVFARASSGRFWGFFVSGLQYLVLPATLLANVVSLVRQNFLVGGGANTPAAVSVATWGYGATLYLDLIGIVAFIILALLIMFGMKWLKRYLFVTLYLRWIAVGVIVGFCIATIALHKGVGFSIIAKNSDLTYGGFTSALTTSFFFFLGFESYAAISQQVKRPNKTVPRGMIVIMIMLALFYSFITVLLIGSATGAAFALNPYLALFEGGNFTYAVKIVGISIVLMAILTTKANSIMQLTFYSTHGGLYPMAKENYVPKKFGAKNKFNSYGNGIWFNICLTAIFSAFFLIIPDIFVWVERIPPSKNPFNLNVLIGLATVLLLITYVVVILLAIWLRIGHGKPISNAYMVLYGIGLLISGFIILNFFGQVIGVLSKSIKSGQVREATMTGIQLGYFVSVFIATPLWYLLYYKPIYKKRLVQNPELQKKLDSEYKLLEYKDQLEAALHIADIPLAQKGRLEQAEELIIAYEFN